MEKILLFVSSSSRRCFVQISVIQFGRTFFWGFQEQRVAVTTLDFWLLARHSNFEGRKKNRLHTG
jgi:hypothetical protein